MIHISQCTLKMYVFPWQLQRVNTVSMGDGTPHTWVMPRAGPGTLFLSRNQKKCPETHNVALSVWPSAIIQCHSEDYNFACMLNYLGGKSIINTLVLRLAPTSENCNCAVPQRSYCTDRLSAAQISVIAGI